MEELDCSGDALHRFEVSGGLALELIALCLLFYSMVVLIDQYLMGKVHVEYLEITIRRYNLSIEAGGCLIAFGSIIPEFTVNVTSLFLSKGHALLGLGTVIGSGCFGTSYVDFTICLCIVSFTAVYYWGSISFSFKSIMIDLLFYCCLLSFITVVIHDLYISFIDAMILVALAPLYLYYSFWIKDSKHKKDDDSEVDGHVEGSSYFGFINRPIHALFGLIIPTYTGRMREILFSYGTIFGAVFGITRCILFIIERILCYVPISEAVLGLTVIAWGNNIEDILNASIAVKKGNPLLAVSALLSTQILNLLCSLGLPWLLVTIFQGPIHVSDTSVTYSLYIATLIVILSFGVFALKQGTFDKVSGVCFGICYLGYIFIEWGLVM